MSFIMLEKFYVDSVFMHSYLMIYRVLVSLYNVLLTGSSQFKQAKVFPIDDFVQSIFVFNVHQIYVLKVDVEVTKY